MISALGTGVLVMLVSLAQPAAQLLDGLPGVQRVEDVLIVDDVPYGDEHERQVMDVATPLAHEGLLPVVVIIHGGGWMQGDKATVRSFLPPTAGGGCLVVAPNYRLAPTDPAPAAIHDVKLILRGGTWQPWRGRRRIPAHLIRLAPRGWIVPGPRSSAWCPSAVPWISRQRFLRQRRVS